MAATSAMSGDVAPWDYDPKAQEELIAGLRKEYSVTLEKPVESIDWSEGDSLDDVVALTPGLPSVNLTKVTGPKGETTWEPAKTYESGDKVVINGQQAQPVLLDDDLSVLTRKTSPKTAADIAVEALTKALVCNEKAGPHPILLEAQTHIRLALDLYHEYLKTLEVH